MSATERLTKTTEKRITEDWQRALPGLGIYRPRHLLRRVGPLLLGVCLDRDSSGDKYKPCFHVHFLGKQFPVVSLTLCTQLKSKAGGPDYIELRFHDERYREAASRLVQQSLLPLQGRLTIHQVIHAYREHVKTPLGQRQAGMLYADCVLLLTWCGRKDEARQLLEETLATVSNDLAFQSFGGRPAFEQKMRHAIEHPDEIRKIVEQQIDALGVANVPCDDLTCRSIG